MKLNRREIVGKQVFETRKGLQQIAVTLENSMVPKGRLEGES